MAQLEAVGRVLGYGGQKTQVTDIFTVVASMIFGIILGSIAIKFGSVPIGLGTAGGLLLSGLIVGWVRSIHPTFGHMPPAARWLFMELGLMFFMAGVGLRAGAGIVEALQNVGVTLFISGILVTTLPVCLGYAFGRIVLKLNPSFLLGALTGAMTSTPSLSVITEESKSQIPALGYTGAYAFANVLLTIAGMVVMRI
jgi:putative transport protein